MGWNIQINKRKVWNADLTDRADLKGLALIKKNLFQSVQSVRSAFY